MRAFHIGRLLQREGDVSLVLAATEQIPDEQIDATKQFFDIKGVIPLRRGKQGALDRLRREVDPRFLAIGGESLASQDRRYFARLCAAHDLVWFHTVRFPDAFGAFRWENSVLDVDDLRSTIYLERSRSGTNWIRSVLDRRMALLWGRRERLFPKRFSAVSVCSSRDRKALGCPENSYVVGNGFDPSADPVLHAPLGTAAEPRLGFIGLMDYGPNNGGIRWFLDNVWRRVRERVPTVRLRLVGKGTDTEEYRDVQGVDGLGWIEDTAGEIASWSAMIVPIRYGGGTRIKIAEAFARKCPVVTTSAGAYGYPLRNGREALLADRPSEFAQACVQVLTDKELRRRLTENAFGEYLKRWTWTAQSRNVAKAVRSCLQKPIGLRAHARAEGRGMKIR